MSKHRPQPISRSDPTSNKKISISLFLSFGLVFILFILGYEAYAQEQRSNAVKAFAGVISNSLWNFESQAPNDYLTLIAAEQNYESLRIITPEGLDFVNVQNTYHGPVENSLLAIKLIHRNEVTVPITYEGQTIGEIHAIWLNENIYVYMYVFLVLILVIGVIGLYWRTLQSKRQLELRVKERTNELREANAELGESEARYRSIFEDSPISLREEDFSGVKAIIDGLRDSGVNAFQAYFDVHPEVVIECMRAVKILKINKNTIDLYRTTEKDMLENGLINSFTNDSIKSFGQQLAAFAEGNFHFDTESIQQTMDGNKIWIGVRISIAPGYEKTWKKAFVSILDISRRKQTEEELSKYHQHLERLVIDRTRDLTVLYEVTSAASNFQDLDELLIHLLERSLSAMRCTAGTIHLVDAATSKLTLSTQQNVKRSVSDGITELYAGRSDIKTVFKDRAFLSIPNINGDANVPDALQESGWNSYIGMPIQDTRKHFLGILSIFTETEDVFEADGLALLSSIADHIGLAVENVHLRHQAEEAAVLEDRQRLARELHDAVSQNLFSASVIAESLPRLWERDPNLVQSNLGDLHRLIRGALAEMRILLLELRPNSMTDIELSELLNQLVAGIKGRTQLEINLMVKGRSDLPILVKKNIFRIAQEALNNVVKHSRAKNVDLELIQYDRRLKLSIHDDGTGFTLDNVEGGHLGLQIMVERAKDIGAKLVIDSAPGSNTEIIVTWPENVQMENGE